MMSKWQVQFVAGVVVLVFAIGITFDGGKLESDWLQFYSYAVGTAVVLLWLWDKWVWHWKVVQRWDVVPRDIRGTWQGTLTSRWIDPETNQTPPAKPAFLVVRQSASDATIALITNESTSKSTLARLRRDAGTSDLDYLHDNRPDNAIEVRSRRHSGSTSLKVIGNPATKLKGYYWTDRDSCGDLEFVRRVSDRAEDFEGAEAFFG